MCIRDRSATPTTTLIYGRKIRPLNRYFPSVGTEDNIHGITHCMRSAENACLVFSQWCYQGLCVPGQGQGHWIRGRGQGQGLGAKDKDKDLKRRTRSRTKSWNQGKANNKLKTKTKNIQKPLSQRHITVNWGDFNRILHILNVIISIILLE